MAIVFENAALGGAPAPVSSKANKPAANKANAPANTANSANTSANRLEEALARIESLEARVLVLEARPSERVTVTNIERPALEPQSDRKAYMRDLMRRKRAAKKGLKP